jgi:hypothetical protein
MHAPQREEPLALIQIYFWQLKDWFMFLTMNFKRLQVCNEVITSLGVDCEASPRRLFFLVVLGFELRSLAGALPLNLHPQPFLCF